MAVRGSLRRSTLAGTILLSLVGLAGAGSLVWITTALDRTAEGIFHALDGVRVCEELRLRLLLHTRSEDRVVRDHLEDRMRTLSRELESYAESPVERSEMSDVQQAVARYLESQAGDEEEALAAAFAAIDYLSDVESERARTLRQQSGSLDAWANRLGAMTAALLALGVPLVLLWLRRAVVQPVLRLRESIERYAAGDRSARARVESPLELREIGARFDEMADALARRRREEMAFLAAVAHDIRNPLSVLATSLASIEGSPLDEKTARVFAILRRQVDQISRLVSDLLDAAQLEATQLPLRMQHCDLRRGVQEVAELFALRADTERIELQLPSEPVLVHGDPSRLNQALSNLVSNALKYSPEGSAVRVAVKRGPLAAEVSVSDRGPGISAAERELVFEPFRRASGAEGEASGAGLGLFIADRIAQAHGGRIELESQPGEGATFRLLLPPVELSGAEGARPPTH